MAGSDTAQSSSALPDENLGLLAIGSSGRWEISIDEAISGTERWFAQIEGPLIWLYFEIPSPEVISKEIRFLASPHTLRRAFPSVRITHQHKRRPEVGLVIRANAA